MLDDAAGALSVWTIYLYAAALVCSRRVLPVLTRTPHDEVRLTLCLKGGFSMRRCHFWAVRPRRCFTYPLVALGRAPDPRVLRTIEVNSGHLTWVYMLGPRYAQHNIASNRSATTGKIDGQFTGFTRIAIHMKNSLTPLLILRCCRCSPCRYVPGDLPFHAHGQPGAISQPAAPPLQLSSIASRAAIVFPDADAASVKNRPCVRTTPFRTMFRTSYPVRSVSSHLDI